MPATLNVVFGPCGAGKTTYAHALARREGAVVLVLDDWGQRLFGPDVHGPINSPSSARPTDEASPHSWASRP